MVVDISAALQIALWANLFVLFMVLICVEGIRRERKRMQRMIIQLVENRKRR
jgi:hypothetical protein